MHLDTKIGGGGGGGMCVCFGGMMWLEFKIAFFTWTFPKDDYEHNTIPERCDPVMSRGWNWNEHNSGLRRERRFGEDCYHN